MSFVQVDDTDPCFDYKDNAWTAGGQSGEFESTSHSASAAGALVEFGPFTGTSIAVFSTVGTNQAKLHFQVDGGDQNIDLPARSGASVQFQQQLYSATSLDPTAQHTLAINLLDSGPFTLDYVLIGGQSNTALRQPSSSVASNITPTHTVMSSGTTSTADLPTSATAIQGVGGSITSLSASPTSDIITSRTPSITSSASFSSGASSSSSPLPAGAGASPSFSVHNSPQSTSLGDPTASTSESASSMSSANTNGPDAVVIGSVAGAIAFFAIVVVSVVLFLRRRRKSAYRGRPAPDNNLDAKPKHRPPLHLSIPSSLSLTRGLQHPPLLPTHSNRSIPTSVKRSDPFGMSHMTPSFLAEDPNDSPVLDIKQRPVSGTTMTTRVTVGTTIDQRVSVPDSVYRYPNLETPMPVPVPVPPISTLSTKASNTSPTETGASSATPSASHFGFGFSDTNPAGTFDTTMLSGYSENGTGATGSVTSACRPLPHIPADAKRADVPADSGPGEHAPQMQHYPHTHRYLPTTPSDAEPVVHQDGGVRLESNFQIRPRRELPPPYQDYGV